MSHEHVIYYSHAEGAGTLPERKRVEQTRWYGMLHALDKLFPETHNTPVGALTEEILDLVAPLCDNYSDGSPALFSRGSTPTRLVLGTPRHYFKPRDIFRRSRFAADIGETTQLVVGVVGGISEGPDLDIMYHLRSGATDHDVLAQIETWAKAKFENGDKYYITVGSVPLAQWNSEVDQRLYTQVKIWERSRYADDRALFRLDLGALTVDEQHKYDARYSVFLGTRDQASLVLLAKKGCKGGSSHWFFAVSPKNKARLRACDALFWMFPSQVHRYLSATRILTQWLWWPPRRKNTDEAETLADFETRETTYRYTHNVRSPWPIFDDDYFDGPFNAEDLEKRERDIVQALVLGFCINPYTFLYLGHFIGLFKHSELGVLLSDANIRLGLYKLAMKQTPFAPMPVREVEGSIREAVQKLAYGYEVDMERVRSISHLGPLILLRQLIKIEALRSDTPVTLARFINLVNPVRYLSHQTSSTC